MVICTDKKYVFVKVYKTGGTSIYHELRKHSKSQNNLGHMYHHGLLPTGVPQDDKTAAKWLRLAAEQGIVEAQYNLGLMYQDGEVFHRTIRLRRSGSDLLLNEDTILVTSVMTILVLKENTIMLNPLGSKKIYF